MVLHRKMRPRIAKIKITPYVRYMKMYPATNMAEGDAVGEI